MDDHQDRQLLQRWRDGDEAAGSALVQRHASAIAGFLRARAGDELEDLVQRTFLACLERLDAVPEAVRVRAYLLGIARNLWLMSLRRKGRQQRALSTAAASPPPSVLTPSGAVASQQQQQLLIDALRSLPEELQTAIELYYWERLRLAEIASVLEVPLGTVKSRLRRGKEQLRDRIERSDQSQAVRRDTLATLDKVTREREQDSGEKKR